MRLKKTSFASLAKAAKAREAHRSLSDGLAGFRTECEASIRVIVDAVRSINAAAGVDPLKPQNVARSLRLNKNLTWKVARVLLAHDPFDAIPMLPGPEGVEIYAKAFESHGASSDAVQALRDAFRGFDVVVQRHFGSRAELDLVLDSLRADGNLEQSRRLAFRGLSGVFGVQARLRLTSHILSPSRADPALFDVSVIAALCGIRRLRPGINLPVFRNAMKHGAPGSTAEPLLASGAAQLSDFLIRDFSSFPEAAVRSIERDGRLMVELAEGPIGKPGESDLVFGTLLPAAYDMFAKPNDRVAQFLTSISFPAEYFVADLLVHRSIRGPEAHRSSFHGALSGPIDSSFERLVATELPIETRSVVVDAAWDSLSVDAMPRYSELIAAALGRLGQDLADFRLIRVSMEFPPVPAALRVGWELPER